jgi:hypothetical protein
MFMAKWQLERKAGRQRDPSEGRALPTARTFISNIIRGKRADFCKDHVSTILFSGPRHDAGEVPPLFTNVPPTMVEFLR